MRQTRLSLSLYGRGIRIIVSSVSVLGESPVGWSWWSGSAGRLADEAVRKRNHEQVQEKRQDACAINW